MNDELDKKLCEKYPKIFAERNLSETETCMCWGFPGDGWYHLIDELCFCIQYHIDHPPKFKRNVPLNWLKWIALKFVPYRWRYRFSFLRYSHEDKKISQVVAEQVKEKFAGLRFYYRGGDDKIAEMVSFAESLSYRICEDCGAMNDVQVYRDGWHRTLCVNCENKRKAEMEKVRANGIQGGKA